MAKFKRMLGIIGRQIWELFKSSIVPALMFFFASSVLLLVIMYDSDVSWNSNKMIWTVVLGVVTTAYMGFIMYKQGGDAYEMLVSGNIKRMSAGDENGGYIISKHKYAKEYRPWKGFGVAAFAIILPVVTGLIFGFNQATIDSASSSGGITGLSIAILIGFITSGWSILPFFYMNASGAAVSYFYSCLLVLPAFIVIGVMYIVGAYARRAKNIRKQEEEAEAARKKAERKKKINYGGLPGTKPKKRK